MHCKLSSRQQAFYQAIKNKISLAELFDSNRGHLNEIKIMNLMNIVIQLRKVLSLSFFVVLSFVWYICVHIVMRDKCDFFRKFYLPLLSMIETSLSMINDLPLLW